MKLLKDLQQAAINVLFALDQLVNAFFGGDPRKTISQRVGLSQMAGHWEGRIAAFFIDMLALPFEGWRMGHCYRAAKETDATVVRRVWRLRGEI